MKKVLSVLGGIVSFIICVILFCIQLGFLTFLSFKTLLNENTINQMLGKIDIVEVINKNLDADDRNEIYKASGSIGLTIDETDKILESEALKSFASSYITNTIKGIFNDSIVVLKSDDIKVLIDEVEKETKIVIKNKEELLTMINENATSIEKTLNISDDIKAEFDEETKMTMKYIMSNEMYIGMIIILIIFFFLIALFRWSLYKPLIWYGITCTISGLFFLIPTLAFSTALPVLTEQLSEYKIYIESVSKVIQTKIFLYSVFTIVIGIIMIVVYSLIKKNKNKDNENFEMLDNDIPNTNNINQSN